MGMLKQVVVLPALYLLGGCQLVFSLSDPHRRTPQTRRLMASGFLLVSPSWPGHRPRTAFS